jgi:uncharacterized delta-60 repeat protein
MLMKLTTKKMMCIGSLMLVALAGCGADRGDTGNSALPPRLLGGSVVVAADYKTIVQQLYIAYFGRPADVGGLASFEAQLAALGGPTDIQKLVHAYHENAGIKSLVDSFATSAESAALYAGDNKSFVTAIYKNVLNRAPDAEGLTFWVGALDKGALTRANASLSIMAGGLANTSQQGQLDGALITQKVTIGRNFTDAVVMAPVNGYGGNSAAAEARAMLSSVTAATDAAAFQANISNLVARMADALAHPRAEPSVLTDFAPSNDRALGITVQPDGKILVAGYSELRGFRDFAMARYHADGALDASFGVGGKVTTDIAAIDEGKSIALQADGKILVAGSSTSSNNVASAFVVARYTANGSPDPTFGGAGRVTTSVSGYFNETPVGIVQLANGKIVVGGSSPDAFLLARYQADGSPDPSFGKGGKVFQTFPQFVDASDMSVLADGTIVLVGSNRYDHDFMVARFNADGSLDASFGTAGAVYTRFDMDGAGNPYMSYGRTDTAGAVAIDASGRVVVAGSSEMNMGQGYVGRVAVARYLSNGALDTSFSARGFALTEFPATLSLHVDIHDVLMQADGKILAVGNSNQKGGSVSFSTILIRYNPDGTLDRQFGAGGFVIPGSAWSTNSTLGYGVHVLPDGKILVGGSGFNGTNMDFALTRYNSDGSVDASFGVR